MLAFWDLEVALVRWLGRVTTGSLNADLCDRENAVDSAWGLRCDPCLLHNPPFWTIHPSMLHSLIFTFAPCFLHTPPFLAWFVHPSLRHCLSFLFAPCLMHTPPIWVWFVHPILLHSLTFTVAACILLFVWRMGMLAVDVDGSVRQLNSAALLGFRELSSRAFLAADARH